MRRDQLGPDNEPYWCKLGQHRLAESSSEKPFIAIDFVVLDGAPDGKESTMSGTLVKYFTGDAMKYTVQALRYLGFNGTSFLQLDPARAGGHSFRGKVVQLIAKHDEYKGDWRIKWETPFVEMGRPLSENKRAWLEEASLKYLQAPPLEGEDEQ